MFASMLEAADFVLVMAYPDEATCPSAGIILMLPRETEGRSVDPNRDVLGVLVASAGAEGTVTAQSARLDRRQLRDLPRQVPPEEAGFREPVPGLE